MLIPCTLDSYQTCFIFFYSEFKLTFFSWVMLEVFIMDEILIPLPTVFFFFLLVLYI